MSGKRLICEQDVLAMGAGEELFLDAFTIATPSALDAAFRLGIAVRREGETQRVATRGKKKPCLWHRILENDGNYVVQVVNGRAQVTRIESTGPVSFGTDSAQEHNK